VSEALMNANMYNKVNLEIVETLRHIVGEGNVLVGAEDMEPYAHDEVVGLRADPEVVVKATSAEQISEIFKLARRERVPVTPVARAAVSAVGSCPSTVASSSRRKS